MAQMVSEEKYQLYAPVAYFHITFPQQTSNNQWFLSYHTIPVISLPEGTQNLMSVATSSTQTRQPAPPLEYSGNMSDDPQKIDSAGNPSSSLPQGDAGASTSAHKSVEAAFQKRERRLMKRRIIAQRYQKMKRGYVRHLEKYLALLEKQNKILTWQVRALKAIYGHRLK